MTTDRGPVPTRLREHLQGVAARGETITYQSLAKLLGLKPPNTIQQLAHALEALMREDAQAQRPFIAALVISKRPPHLPGLGFFECAAQLGRFRGENSVHADFHASELRRVHRQWKERG
jgi:hypothetical protein